MRSSKYILFFVLCCIGTVLLSKTVAFFSPDDQLTSHLIAHINAAQQRVYAAVYMLTDKKIATALINAKKRNVDVQVITDKSTIETKYGKAQLLSDNNIPVFVFNTRSSKNSEPLMHNKFAIIDAKVWTGSFNWTVAGNRKNQENAVVIDEWEPRERFLKQFDVLKHRCVLQKGPGGTPPSGSALSERTQEKMVDLLERVKRKLRP